MASAEGVSRKGPNWLALPREVTENILQRLHIDEIVTSACLVCPLWWNICKDPHMWRTIAITHPRYSFYNSVDICSYAIRRSYGHLEDISIDSIATDDLMDIANSTSVLRRLCLLDCNRISDRGMMEAVKKFPLLEELDISYSSNITKDSLEEIGRCCPFLKTLKFNQISFWRSSFSDDNEEAFAIAQTMPALRYLQIIGNTISDVGLLAILNGCPLLEFLDLRCCEFLDLSGSLGKRCREQIKHLLLVIDPDDFPSVTPDNI
ncbi:putative F-box/LRR-repeat protein 23 [Lotus japonicus]|uniref:putative F-box/LRR-repeat protein 23 n=1 Tax=Lotus japonicus TaxID=34305 RepID=UPI00258B3552|nr:putative F-box/LRR-repeat protein 23 [Lotus japonicus]XP_057450089.1 putative F-box/LRR-repeat protein 23 [Lotus japonicus]